MAGKYLLVVLISITLCIANSLEECPSLKIPENGKLFCSSRGYRCYVACFDGHLLIGDDFFKCDKMTGQWSSPQPFCYKDETKIDDSLNALSSEEPANSSKMLKVLEEAVMNEMRGKRSMGGFSRRSGSLCSKVYCKVTSCEFFKRLQDMGSIYHHCKRCVDEEKYCESKGHNVF